MKDLKLIAVSISMPKTENPINKKFFPSTVKKIGTTANNTRKTAVKKRFVLGREIVNRKLNEVGNSKIAEWTIFS